MPGLCSGFPPTFFGSGIILPRLGNMGNITVILVVYLGEGAGGTQ